MQDLLEILKISGPVAVIALFSVWRMDRNYDAISKRLIKVEDEVIKSLANALADSRHAIQDCRNLQRSHEIKAKAQRLTNGDQ